MRHTVIIGGGAAGMAAAIAAARAGDRVTVLDRNRRALKKLSVTGNGRGNLLNAGEPVYYGNTDFALETLRRMPYASIAAFLQSCGVALTEEDEGRVYPASYLAASAVDALLQESRRQGVAIESGMRVKSIEPQNGGFVIRGMRLRYAQDTPRKSGKMKPGALLGEEPFDCTADRVIVAVGGAAAPMHGTDGTAYGLLTALGHKLIEPKPALCAFLTDKAPLAGLAGQRVRASLALLDENESVLAESRGEALFAEDGVSGIAAMQLSRFAAPGCTLSLDLREAVMGWDFDIDVDAWLEARPGRDLAEKLVGAASPALSQAIVRAAAKAPAADVLSAYRLSVKGVRGFESAQVTAGGVDPADFDPATMESRLVPGLYAAGEVLDVDGACGGFNLMFAFASGLLAGRSKGSAL